MSRYADTLKIPHSQTLAKFVLNLIQIFQTRAVFLVICLLVDARTIIARTTNGGLRSILFQAAAEADQELRGVAHRAGLLHREDLRRPEAGAADRNDERLSQLPHHLSGE